MSAPLPPQPMAADHSAGSDLSPQPGEEGTNPRSLEHRPEPCLLLVGTDHRRAGVELRERVAMSAEEAAAGIKRLRARPEIAEALILSTCNRTEVYLAPRDEEGARRLARELIFRPRAAEIDAPGRLYVQRGREAARHLLAVACGLESMVLGEPEILGQVKQAASAAEASGASGPILSHLFRCALASGRRARAETAIGAGAVSLGYAVVELAKNIFQRMEEARVLMVGAGEIARSTARALVEKGARGLLVANRTRARAESFQEEFPSCEVIPFEARCEGLGRVEVAVVSTSAEEPVLTRAHLAQAMRQRQGRPLLVVDLSVPRNVDPEARRVGNLFLHPIDSLQSLIDRNLSRRREEVPRVEAIVAEELGRFYKWYRSLAVEPLVAELQRQAEALRHQELAQALDHFPAETHGELDRLTRSLVRKLLHNPSSRLRHRSDEDGLARLDLVRDLFQLDPEED